MSDAGGRETEPAEPIDGESLAPGTRFAGLIVEGEIGRGGMGVIYRVLDPDLDRIRALKVLPRERSSDPEFRERFQRESRLAAAIEHPAVAPVFRAGDEQGRLYLLMRFVDGPSLAEELAARGRLPLTETLGIIRQVADGLDAAHATGLVHRDVKPANVLLEGDPSARRAFLCDFGISKLTEATTQLTETGKFLGTVDYVAPEQLEEGPIDRRADVYSLACVAFHALTGEPPFRRDTQLATMFAHANAPRPSLGPGMPSKLNDALARGMAVRPDERTATAGDLADDLEAAAGAASVAPTQRLDKPERSPSRGVLGGALLAALAGLAVAAVLVLSGDEEPEPAPSPDDFEVVAFEAPRRPLGITVGTQRVWAASPATHKLSYVSLDDPGERAVEVEIGDEPTAVAVGFDALWVADRALDVVLRLDLESGAELDRFDVEDEPIDVAVGDDHVWVANAADDSVSRVDPATGEVRRVPVGAGARPTALAVGDRGVWVANRDAGTVVKIDLLDEQPSVTGAPIPTGSRPNDVAIGAGLVWVTDNIDGTVTRIDPNELRIIDQHFVTPKPRAVALGLEAAWVTSGEQGTVTRLDDATAEAAGEPVDVGPDPAGIAVGSDSVWVAGFGGSSVTQLRIGGG